MYFKSSIRKVCHSNLEFFLLSTYLVLLTVFLTAKGYKIIRFLSGISFYCSSYSYIEHLQCWSQNSRPKFSYMQHQSIIQSMQSFIHPFIHYSSIHSFLLKKCQNFYFHSYGRYFLLNNEFYMIMIGFHIAVFFFLVY